jgi:hypothetical protein
MALSNQTVLKLADALVPEVIDHIYQDERWVEFLHEIIPDAVTTKIGGLDEELLFELSMVIMDRIVMKPFK